MSSLLCWPGRHASIMSFGLVGVGSTLAYAALALMGERYLQWPGSGVSLAAYFVAGIISYLGHRHFTFHSDRQHSIAVPRFMQLFILGIGLAFAIPLVMSDWAGLPRWVSVTATCITIPVLNAVMLSRHVFGASLLGGKPPASPERGPSP